MTAHAMPDPQETPGDPDTGSPGRDVFAVPAGRRNRTRHVAVLACIAVGGGIGSAARYLVSVLIGVPEHGFPWGTFAANLAGCFALGLLMVFLTEVWPPGRYARPFVAIGVIGGFTTFSTLVVEIRDLAATGLWSRADAYALSSLVAGLVAVWCGMLIARVIGRVPVRRSVAMKERR